MTARKTSRGRPSRPTVPGELPFSAAFVEDFRAAPVDLQVAVLGICAVSFDPSRRASADRYLATPEQHAESKRIKARTQAREGIRAKRAALGARHEQERERLYDRHDREYQRFEKRYGTED